MKVGELLSPVVHAARDLDARWQRVRRPDTRRVIFDARTSMEYGMMAPVHRRLLGDPRIETCLMSSERPARATEIFRDAPRGTPVIHPRAAMMHRFDAYIAADFLWASLPRGACRVQMFHGVAGKWSHIYDRPASSMRQWDRLFFINRRRLDNYLASGAIDQHSPAIRLVGMPKSDCLVDGTLTRDGVLTANALDRACPTVLYAPTWTRHSSLNAMGEEVVRGLVDAGYRVFVKLHDNSLDRNAVMNSGGIDWVGRLEPILAKGRGHLIRASDASPWLVASDVLITDHSSIGFEYLLRDRPLIRIAMPQLIHSADIGSEYVELMAAASTTVEDAPGVIRAVEEALAHPEHLSATRRKLAAELFHAPGKATDRAIHELYEVMEFPLPASAESIPASLSMAPQRAVIR